MAEASVCQPLRRDMLPHPVDVHIAGGAMDLAQATLMAQTKARELHPDVMLVAWFDRKTGAYSPQITCCHDDQPAWLAYAKSRGADLFISMNREEFVFAYKRL